MQRDSLQIRPGCWDPERSSFFPLSVLTLGGPRAEAAGGADAAAPLPRTAIPSAAAARHHRARLRGTGTGQGRGEGRVGGVYAGAGRRARGEVQTDRRRGCALERGGDGRGLGARGRAVGGAPGRVPASSPAERVSIVECVVRAAGTWRGRRTFSLVLPLVSGVLAEVSVRAGWGPLPRARVSAGSHPRVRELPPCTCEAWGAGVRRPVAAPSGCPPPWTRRALTPRAGGKRAAWGQRAGGAETRPGPAGFRLGLCPGCQEPKLSFSNLSP